MKGLPENLYILLADDDADDRLLFEDALNEAGIDARITMVKDGQELISHLESAVILPHILFLDLNMPVLNGLQCLEEIRKHIAYNSLFICIYSTTARHTDIAKAYQLGANLFINKPSTFTGLKMVLTKVLTTDLDNNVETSEEKFLVKA